MKLRQVKGLLCFFGRILIHVREDRGNSSGDKSEHNYTHHHQDDAENSLQGVGARHVSVSHSGHRGDCEVHGMDVLIPAAHHHKICVVERTRVSFRKTLAYKNPDASEDVIQKEEQPETHKKALISHVDSKLLRKLFSDIRRVLHDFEHLD